MKTIEELGRLLAESEASDTGVWKVCRGDEDSDIQDSDGQGIAARVADVDARLIVAMRNALPALLEVAKAAKGDWTTDSKAAWERLQKALDALEES